MVIKSWMISLAYVASGVNWSAKPENLNKERLFPVFLLLLFVFLQVTCYSEELDLCGSYMIILLQHWVICLSLIANCRVEEAQNYNSERVWGVCVCTETLLESCARLGGTRRVQGTLLEMGWLKLQQLLNHCQVELLRRI